MIRRRAVLIAIATVLSATVSIPLSVAFGMSKETPVLVTVRPSTTVVPKGKLLRVSESTESGELVGRFVVDTARRVMVHESLEAISLAPFSALSICDESGRSEICGATLEVFRTPLTYEQAITGLDHLAGKTLERTGTKRIEGRLTDVVESNGSFQGEDGSVAFDITGFVDPVTGLVIREEIGYGSGTLVVEREFVDPAAEEYGDFTHSDADWLAEEMRAQRIRELEEAGYSTYALMNEAEGLSLLWVMFSTDGNWCRLEYQSVSDPGLPAASVTSWNLAAYPDYPSDMLNALSEAKVDDDAEIQRVSFRIGDTAVQVQVEKPLLPNLSAAELASRLVLSSAGGLE